MLHRSVMVRYLCAILFVVAPRITIAQNGAAPNPNCTLIVPANPLSAEGLATPYQLVATDPTGGDCHETDKAQAAFVQAAVFDPASGQIAIYNPLVVDQGATPAMPPVVPTLPANAIVALWFGYNGDTLTLQGVRMECWPGPGASMESTAPTSDSSLTATRPLLSRQHTARSARVKFTIPPLGTAADGRPCPTVRDFFAVDQDQSDNLPTSYLVTSASGLARRERKPIWPCSRRATLGNPSDNRLVDVALDGALGCTPWKAPDLADPGQMVPALPLNELQARARQASPVALVPAGDPMAQTKGERDLVKVNAYRRGVDQPPVAYPFRRTPRAIAGTCCASRPPACCRINLCSCLMLLIPRAACRPTPRSPIRSLLSWPNDLSRVTTSWVARTGCTFPIRFLVTVNAQGVTTAATIDVSVSTEVQAVDSAALNNRITTRTMPEEPQLRPSKEPFRVDGLANVVAV